MDKTNPADKVEHWPIDRLVPYAKNSRTHSDEQIAQIAASIKEWGFTTAVLVDEKGGIIAGHGRVLAARKLGIDTLPVMVATGWTEPQKRAYVIADNKLALNAGWDNELLKLELKDLDLKGFNLTLTGFSLDEMAELFDESNLISEAQDSDNPYTAKINTPIYEPKGEKPELNDLYDTKKTTELITAISNSPLQEQEKQFLIAAASRHIVFDYSKIANFYAHSSKECQALMEDSALVIVDFDKAIENGLVRMTNDINNIFNVGDNEDE
jgi:hypothetical protein